MKALSCILFLLLTRTTGAATVAIDGAVTNQVIDGFGVNANYRSWNGTELQPVLDAFIDQAGMTLFRVVYDLSDWETTNDNAVADSFNWTYYNSVFGSNEFARLWDMFAYLNSRGITNGAFFNFMGWGPAWMMAGDGRTLAAGMENEWAEMIASALVYARNTRGLQFRLVAPNNEPNIPNEGIRMNPTPYTNCLRKLAQKLDANGLSDVRFVAPDLAGGGTGYMPEMLADPVIMGKLAHFGVHSYSPDGGGSGGVLSLIQSSAYPDRTFWVTEFNVSCAGCDTGTKGAYDWDYTRGTADFLLEHLLNGASGGLVWEGYDSIYAHHGYNWSYWGLFGVDNENATNKTYTPRKNFYTVAQISKWVRPGAQRITVTGTTAPFSPLLAFKHAGLGQITIVGINTSASAATLTGTLTALPAVSTLDLYYTSATANLAHAGSFPVNNGTFTATIPADCVFTLASATGIGVTITNPVNGATFSPPATIPIHATASTTNASITQVQFFNGATLLGTDPAAPFSLIWSNVALGTYNLTARATDNAGNVGTSAVVTVTVTAEINLAPTGTGYIWHSLTTSNTNTPRVAATGINDGDLASDVRLLPGTGWDNPNAFEGAGVVWTNTQPIARVIFKNGSYDAEDNGVFAGNFQLQFSTDGITWTTAGPQWSIAPAYTYNSPASAGVSFTFTGGVATARAVRVVGRVRTSETYPPPNSWVARATELQAFPPVPSVYDQWKTGYGLPADTLDTADDDHDGLALLLEYGFDLNPTVASVSGLPTLHGFDFTFYRARAELTYEVQHSTNLVTWLPLAINPGNSGGMVTVTYTPDPQATCGFLRLKITRP